MRVSARVAWFLLPAATVLAVAVVAVPVFLIQPFAPQTPGSLALSYVLRRWSPLVTLVAAAGCLWLTWRIWRERPRFGARAAASLLFLLVTVSAWLARQNHFEWMFAPLPGAGFVRAADADFVAPEDMVLTVAIAGDPAAYPVRQLAYHHLVEDAVGKVPIVATY